MSNEIIGSSAMLSMVAAAFYHFKKSLNVLMIAVNRRLNVYHFCDKC
ncbi:hypothetical protein [Lactobacillus xylocopicola]|uniref:Uncharacterized protein n=1 Tax=Lactobacillus xylocopicola TaxID=2976676 RepID=A0ABM8BFL1_9LACO|nr:hypothetical protein [Lactobacillus xylocopicola]BDR60041.1 hypothetical protein KIM322_03020 [Lactobacillus xylocopicola]